MNKFLIWLYENYNKSKSIVMLQTLTNEYEICIVIKNKKIQLLIFIRNLIFVILSLIIFFIFYKYNIQLISLYYIKYIKIYFNFAFIIYIYYIIYLLVRGYYEILILKKETDNVSKGFILLGKLVIFLINFFLLYSIFDLNIELFLQYNIIFVIDFIIMFIFWFYKNVFDYEISSQKVLLFLNYPWIILIIIILIKLNKNFWYLWVFLFDIALLIENSND